MTTWLTEEVLAECRRAEVWWAERLTAINARANHTACKWCEQEEYRQRWELLREEGRNEDTGHQY